MNNKKKNQYVSKKNHTLLSDFLLIFLAAAGGHATAGATAFIIFDWLWIGDCCWCCKCPELIGDDNGNVTIPGDCCKCGDVCVCEIHCSDSDSSHGTSL